MIVNPDNRQQVLMTLEKQNLNALEPSSNLLPLIVIGLGLYLLWYFTQEEEYEEIGEPEGEDEPEMIGI
jgi:hypothetical protein